MSEVTLIDKCRLCGSHKLSEFVHFNSVPLANCYLDNGKEAPCFDLTVVSCDECECHQLKQDIDPNILFGSLYSYSTPPALSNHFKNFAGTVIRDLNLNDKSFVVDIGGNNGLLCSYFQQLTEDVYNIEPSKNIADESKANGIYTLTDFFDDGLPARMANKYPDTAFDLVFSNGKNGVRFSPRNSVDVIISNNVFAHSPTVFSMMRGVKQLLKKGGVFVQENAYLLDTLKNNDLGQIYGEHYFYHHITSLFSAYKKLGMTLYHVEFNNAQCGSFRIYVKNYPEYPVEDSVTRVLNEERWTLDQKKNHFIANIEKLKKDFLDYLEARKGKRVGLVGVPAKVALLISEFGLEPYIYAAYEDAPLKIGKEVPGTNIKIKPMEELKECDICLVGAYNFADSIIKRFGGYNKEWCVPLPKFQIYTH